MSFPGAPPLEEEVWEHALCSRRRSESEGEEETDCWCFLSRSQCPISPAPKATWRKNIDPPHPKHTRAKETCVSVPRTGQAHGSPISEKGWGFLSRKHQQPLPSVETPESCKKKRLRGSGVWRGMENLEEPGVGIEAWHTRARHGLATNVGPRAAQQMLSGWVTVAEAQIPCDILASLRCWVAAEGARRVWGQGEARGDPEGTQSAVTWPSCHLEKTGAHNGNPVQVSKAWESCVVHTWLPAWDFRAHYYFVPEAQFLVRTVRHALTHLWKLLLSAKQLSFFFLILIVVSTRSHRVFRQYWAAECKMKDCWCFLCTSTWSELHTCTSTAGMVWFLLV